VGGDPLEDLKAVHHRHGDVQQQQPWRTRRGSHFRRRDLLKKRNQLHAIAESKERILDSCLTDGATEKKEVILVIFGDNDRREFVHGNTVAVTRAERWSV
jgi:hypothetical protein